MNRVLITAGGSGGHLYPALAVADIFLEKGFQVYLLTSKKRPANIKFNSNIKIIEGFSVGWNRSLTGIFVTSWSLLKDFILSFKILSELKPILVLGMGGYVSIAPILTAFIFGIPRAIHEQNIIPGLANRFLAPFVNKIFISFPNTNFGAVQSKTVYTGLPLRKELYNTRHFNHDVFTVLVMGGSQGARIINDTIIEIVERKLIKDVKFIHITGARDFDRLKERIERLKSQNYEVYSYREDVWVLYEKADLVISRAGAGSVVELATVGLPAILIPYKGAEGHQYLNAKWFVDNGRGVIIDQSQLSPNYLAERIQEFRSMNRTEIMLNCEKVLDLPKASYKLVEETLKMVGG
ncbi:MAG: undecaprenyldiphospho-muramoylpentapeptide beta-N-acetylglucosaminyltransferase [bacterium]